MHARRLFIFFFCNLLIFLAATHVSAAYITVSNPFKFATFCGLVKALAGALFELSIAVGIVVIVYAGFLFMTSNGEPGKIQTAKNALLFAVLGIIVGISAQAIVSIVYSFFKVSFSSCT